MLHSSDVLKIFHRHSIHPLLHNYQLHTDVSSPRYLYMPNNNNFKNEYKGEWKELPYGFVLGITLYLLPGQTV